MLSYQLNFRQWKLNEINSFLITLYENASKGGSASCAKYFRSLHFTNFSQTPSKLEKQQQWVGAGDIATSDLMRLKFEQLNFEE